MKLLALILPFVMYWLNWVRGSRMVWLFGKSNSDWYNLKLHDFFINKLKLQKISKAGDLYAALAFGLIVGIITLNPFLGICIAVAYFIGEAPGWAKFIRHNRYWFEKDYQAAYNENEVPLKEGRWGLHQLTSLFVDETKDFTKFSILGLFFRGIIWWIPVYAVLVFFKAVTLWAAIPAILAMGIAFPTTYWFFRHDTRDPEMIRIGAEEKSYGAAQGIILALSLIFGAPIIS